jgi:protein-S-isoprenylcysteine O-methyltransferase Ste14
MAETTRRWGSVLGTIVFTVLVPGTVAGYVPWRLATTRPATPWLQGPLPGVAGAVLLALGAAGYLWCAWDFAMRGLGTPAPIAEPRRLVVHGLYRYSRNPMYVSVLLAILGQALLLGSAAVLWYGAAVWAFFFVFVLGYEEPRLRHLFGDEYLDYTRRVPRWIGARKAQPDVGDHKAT